MVRVAITVEQNWNRVPGGTARSTNDLIDGLRRHTDVAVCGLAGGHRRDPVLALPVDLELCTIPVPGRALMQLWSRATLPRVDRWIDRCDVVHATAYVLPPTTKPSVVTVHDLAFRRYPEWFTENGVLFLERFLARIVDDDSEVIVPSATTAADCVDAGISTERIHTIPWGVAPSAVTDDDVASVRRRFGLPDEFVLFVGTLEPRKNVATLVSAMQLLPKTPLVVVGPRGWGTVDPGDAIVLGELADHDLASVIAASSVLAHPSSFEGFGLPVLEAMAEGTPVVVTAATAPADVAGEAGLAVDTTRPDVLADALRSIVESPDLGRRLGDAGRHRAAEFTWQATALATADVYRRRPVE